MKMPEKNQEKANCTHAEQINSVRQNLLNESYWVIDILPEQVPAGGSGQYFTVEKYYLQPFRLADIHRRFTEVLIKLNCYYDFELCMYDGEQYLTNPAPEALAFRISEMQEDLCIVLPEAEAVITLYHDDTYMTVYHPSEAMRRRLKLLAAAEGLFLRKPKQDGPAKAPAFQPE